MRTRTCWKWQLLLLFVVALCSNAVTEAATISVTAKVGANEVTIGDIDVTVGIQGSQGNEQATFTFDDPWGKLDNMCDFRWFQIITSDDCPVPWDSGKDPVFPFVDPPSGGWDYQSGDGGADADPFYENSDPGNYAYPNFSARHEEGVKSWTDDGPGLCENPNTKTEWETYLVVTGPGIEKKVGEKKFEVLAGYKWSVGRDGTGAAIKTGPTEIANPNTANLDTAMDNSGFADWSALTGTDLSCCIPEPSTFVSFSIAMLVCAGGRGRRKFLR